MTQDVFLIDANSIITPYHSFYPFDFASGFWSLLGQNIENGKIAILDMVIDEIEKGTDRLTEWLHSLNIKIQIDHRESSILEYYGQILQYIQNIGLYKQEALKEWSRNDVADPWLIATAKTHDFCIVTFEKPNSNPDPKNPWKAAKIPEVANIFNVKTVDLFTMMRTLDFKL